MKVVTVVGARPQFIKAAAVSREIAKHPGMQEIIVHTGQHFDTNMSDIFFEEMRIPRPQYFLDIHSVGHGAMTGRMMEAIEEVLIKEKPSYVLVYGDTNSTLAGALAAKKLQVKVVHVEAGLRSHNMRMPEEINRVLTDRISDILCCPTDNAVENLRKEGFGQFPCTIGKTGDVMQDVAYFYSVYSAEKSRIIKEMGVEGKDFALCTIHRAENTDDPVRLASIVGALNEISRKMPVILPLHPRTRKIMASCPVPFAFEPIHPVGYFDMIELIKHAKVVVTDSGGLQKEAFFFDRPCVTLRDETEWVELLSSGANRLAGADRELIVKYSIESITDPIVFNKDLYGNGRASENIVKYIKRDYSNVFIPAIQ